jgi:hypothetical protein
VRWHLAGAWFASPDTSYAQKLIAAGMLLLAGPVDGDEITERGARRIPAASAIVGLL